MGLVTLAVFGHKYDRRQSNIERNYQARSRVAERLTAENNPDATPRIDNAEAQRPYATPGNKLIPLWPLGLLLGIAAVVSAEMLRRSFRGRADPKRRSDEGMPT